MTTNETKLAYMSLHGAHLLLTLDHRIELREFIYEICEQFLQNRIIHVFLQKGRKGTVSGEHYYRGNRVHDIFVYETDKKSIGYIKAIIAHELGHAYARANNYHLTMDDYREEIYADDFSAMCMGNEWNNGYRSYYPHYGGFSRSRKYISADNLELKSVVPTIDNTYAVYTAVYKGCIVRLAKCGNTRTGKQKYSVRVEYNGKTRYHSKALMLNSAKKQAVLMADFLLLSRS